jgi:hypothetical protein
LNRKVCVIEEVTALVRGTIYVVEFSGSGKALDGEAEVAGIVQVHKVSGGP